MLSIKKIHPILKIVDKVFFSLPTPSNISYFWNFGSILGLCLMMQILTGIFLAMHYCSDISLAFSSVNHIMRDVNFGWVMRIFHANGASFFFIAVYFHIARGIYYSSFFFKFTWFSGILILLSLMATAFLGYVLPWGQMSFWGATVITNLFSAIPMMGEDLVKWMWGGFSVDNPALTRFFSLHFFLPFFILFLVIVHLVFLHETGSNNPLGLNSNFDKIFFNPYFLLKDLLGYLFFFFLIFMMCFFSPWVLGDPENFIQANPMVTPIHIQPEWYFLMAYAILRSVPNKLGGVVALVMSILILFICPFLKKPKFQSIVFYSFSKNLFWIFINIFLLLTWIGMCPVENPFIFIGQMLSILYFSFFFIFNFSKLVWDKLLSF